MGRGGERIGVAALMLHLGLFNSALMNEVIYNFKCYEDSSLHYIAARPQPRSGRIGLFDTSVDMPAIVGE